MSEKEQVDQLASDVDAMINRYRTEYDLSYASVVGVFQMKIHMLCEEAADRSEEV
jgi:hypothetical protein